MFKTKKIILRKKENYYKSFCMRNFSSILTIKPIRIKNIPKYELKESSNKINFM